MLDKAVNTTREMVRTTEGKCKKTFKNSGLMGDRALAGKLEAAFKLIAKLASSLPASALSVNNTTHLSYSYN